MREYKFRGKDVVTGEWKYGDLITLNVNDKTAYLIVTDDYAIVDKELKPWQIAFTLNVDIFMVDPDSVGQFTGLVDRNGNEIYEGDVIKGKYETTHLIRYNEEECSYLAYRLPLYEFSAKGHLDQDWINEYSKIVIGNIHDNPELLKE